MTGLELLADFKATASGDAFANLVRQYANLVYSTATRRLSDGTLAEDATQTVFLRLARQPPSLTAEAELVAWLHRTTLHVSIDLWRSETRRQAREQKAAAMEPPLIEDQNVWDEMAPHLDEALNE